MYAVTESLYLNDNIIIELNDSRNERDTAMARMAQRLTNEGSTFLGEKIIEVRRVGPPQEVWYKLGELINY